MIDKYTELDTMVRDLSTSTPKLKYLIRKRILNYTENYAILYAKITLQDLLSTAESLATARDIRHEIKRILLLMK